MAAESWQKLKLLKLAQILGNETDEQHPLTTAQLCKKLRDMDIPCDRRVLSMDIATLNAQGIEVLWKWVGKAKGYYIEDRSFSVLELKILIDAVQAAGFITERKTNLLTDKIAALGGGHQAEILKGNIVCFNNRKHTNEAIYYNVDALERALQEKKKVIFRYFDLGVDGEKIYRREGHHYVVEPVTLVYNEDNYYVVAYSDRHDDTANYRVDRMDSVEVIDEDISEKAIELKDSIGEYTQEAIKMYGGPVEDVILEFDRSLMGAVYDRFGESTEMIPSEEDEDRIIATIRVQLSPTFWGWLFQFGHKMKVLGPDEVIEERKARVRELL